MLDFARRKWAIRLHLHAQRVICICMTHMIVMDEDYSRAGIKRRLKEEFARQGIRSERDAAHRYGRPQQWVSRRMTGEAKWAVDDLEDFCRRLGLSYVYVISGIRPVPTPPPGDRNRPTIGQIIEFPQRNFEVLTGAAGAVDEDATRYVALADESLLLPRMDSNHQPSDCLLIRFPTSTDSKNESAA